MPDPTVAPKTPFAVRVEAGKKYAWCRCGRSARQPFCDGAHKSTGIEPMVFTAGADETVYLCGCKHTKDAPFCDGSHGEL